MRSFRGNTIWLGAVLATLLAPGCYTSHDDPGDSGGGPGEAQVRISLGERVGGAPEGSADDKAGVPPGVTHFDLRVSGPDMDDFGERYETPDPGEDLVVELTFPAGPDRIFEVDALHVDGSERILYQGVTVQDLVPGDNVVHIQMEPRVYLQGTVQYISPEWPYEATEPLADHAESQGPLPIETDASGFYEVGPLEAGPHRVEVYPEDCPDPGQYPEWADCFAFGEITLTAAGEVGVLDLFIIPPPGAFLYRQWASSIVPNEAEVGDEVTVYGTDFKMDSVDPPTIAFDAVEGYFLADGTVDWSPEHITAVVKDGAHAGFAAGYVFNVGVPETNWLPFTVLRAD